MECWEIPSLAIAAHQPQVLRSDAETRAIVIQLPAGELLSEHQVHERAFLVVIGGRIEISQDGRAVSGGPGLLAHFEPNERREIRALEDARLLLMLAPWPGEGHPSRA
jgi:quercetin dioxygenase-like cupin family protein